MARFESSVTLSCRHQEAFDFLARPANVARISPPEMGLRLIDVPELLELGSRVEFEIAGLGPAQRVVHEVVEFDRPRRFTEQQVEGPLQAFVHEHIVEESGDGVVVVTDRIEFQPPGGLAGFVVTEEVIRGSLSSGFEHRHRELKRLLDEEGARP